MIRKSLFVVLAATIPGLSSAAVVLDFDTAITGQPSVNGSQLIARLTISNSATDVVDMTFEHFGNPDSGRFIGGLWLNVSPFKSVSLVGAPMVPVTGVTSSLDGEGAPGMQYHWDLHVDFDNAPPADRMNQGRVASWQLTGVGLVETDFLAFANKGSAGVDDLYGLIHLQGIRDTPGIDSTWYGAVPEPGTMLALGAGLAAMAARRRKSR